MLFNKTSQEVDKGPLGLEMSETDRQRVLRYSTYWQFYLGRQWAWKREEGEPQMTFNYARAFVDKSVSFLFGKGFNWVIKDERTRQIINPALKTIWKDNNQVLWGMEAGQMGAVSGDTFVKVGWEDPNEFNLLKKGRVRMIILDSSHCFPEWHPHNKDVMTSFRISYMYEVPTLKGQKTRRKYTEILTGDKFIILDGDTRYEWDNGLGFIPIVHIKNRPIAGGTYGLSDLNDFIGLNREYNEKSTNISDIINYHQAPITVVYGAKATSLEKGANKLWSGLPKDAKVENLQMQSDLNASVEYLRMLKESMHELTQVPEATLGKQQAVSNTSGVALHVQYQPLMEQRAVKMLTFGTGISKINKMALTIYGIKNGVNFEEECNNENALETQVTFPDPLPKDRLILLQEITQRMQLPFPLVTPPMALEMLGDNDIDKTLEHIMQWIPYMQPQAATMPPPQGAGDVPDDNEDVKSDVARNISNSVQAPSGMTAATATNAGGFLNKETMTPRGAVQSDLTSIVRTDPGW